MSTGARGAQSEECHGPLERWLDFTRKTWSICRHANGHKIYFAMIDPNQKNRAPKPIAHHISAIPAKAKSSMLRCGNS